MARHGQNCKGECGDIGGPSRISACSAAEVGRGSLESELWLADSL